MIHTFFCTAKIWFLSIGYSSIDVEVEVNLQSAATAMIWPASCDLACWKSSKGELWRGEEKGKKLADGRRHIRQCHSTAAFLPLIANCSPPNLSLHVFTLILGLCWKTKSGGKKRVFKNCAHFKNLSAFTASDYSLAFLPHTLHDFGLIHRTGVVLKWDQIWGCWGSPVCTCRKNTSNAIALWLRKLQLMQSTALCNLYFSCMLVLLWCCKIYYNNSLCCAVKTLL